MTQVLNVMKITFVLLLAGLSGQLAAEAGGCLAGIRGLFCGRDGKNYGILAEHLYTATQSSELADNTKAAESLLIARPDASESLISLINAFRSLGGDSASMCSEDGLARMRLVAEASREGGNLGPGKITEPIRRLNRLLVKFISDAWPICSTHLDAKWARPWNPSFDNKDTERYVRQLRRMPITFAYAEHLRKPNDPRYRRYYWGSRLSRALAEDAKSDLAVGKKLDPDCSDPTTSTNKTVLALQLREYVYRPCEEFVALEEARNVLMPYNNLVISWYITQEEGLSEYYKNEDEPRGPSVYPWGDANARVRDLVFDHRACQRLLAMPERDVLSQLYKSRLEDQRH